MKKPTRKKPSARPKLPVPLAIIPGQLLREGRLVLTFAGRKIDVTGHIDLLIRLRLDEHLRALHGHQI